MGLLRASIVTVVAFLVLQMWFIKQNPLRQYVKDENELYVVLAAIFIIELML